MRALFVLCFLIACGRVLAAPSPLADISVLVDPSGMETIESVSRPERAGDFVAAPQGLAAGYTRKVHWMRLRLDAPATGPLLLEIQPPYLDDLRLYQPDGAGGFRLRQTGDIFPFNTRDVPSRGFVWRIDFPAAAAQTLYLRVATSSTSLLLPRAWLPADYALALGNEYLLLGLYYGVMLAMLMFNFWHGHWRHDPEHRAFLTYLLTVFLFMLGLNGLVALFLAPAHPLIGHHWVSSLLFITVGMAAHFHRRILAIDRTTPLLNAYFLGMIGLSVLCFGAYLAGYFTEAARLVTLAALLFPVFGLARTAALWRQGRAGSAFLALAYALSLFSYLLSVLSLQGVLQGAHWQLYSFQGGALLALLAFNFSLFARLRHIQHQRDTAIEEARSARVERDAEALSRERQGALLAMLTHELKTPLAVIRLALDRLAGEAGVRRHAATAIADIAGVIDRCRYADRLDHGEVRIERQPCRVVEILDACIAQANHSERIHCRVPAVVPSLESDAALLRMICANLVDNALKYGAAQTPIEIALREKAHADGRPGLELGIANVPGPAGAPDPQHVFQRYHREPAAHAQTGSGLGLYLVRQLAGLLGGEIVYRPPDADGLIRFVLWLPLASR